MYAQNLPGSLSPSSRFSQVTRRDRATAAAQVAQATDLPAPAGAVIAVTGCTAARSISPVRRLRGTTSAPSRGTRSLSSSSSDS